MNLASDSFEVEYDGARTNASDCLDAIRALGFSPTIVNRSKVRDRLKRRADDPIPEPIASAMAHAKLQDRLSLVYFHAEWCAPCRALDENVFPVPAVKKAMKEIQFVRVDTDDHPDAGNAYGVTTLPTLLILDEDGLELGRMAGLIDRAGLLGWLDRVLMETTLP